MSVTRLQAEAVMVPDQQIGPRNTEGWSPIQGEFWRGGPISPDFKHVEVLPRFTEQSADYLRTRRDKANPFLLYVALPAPHTPWLPGLLPHRGLLWHPFSVPGSKQHAGE